MTYRSVHVKDHDRGHPKKPWKTVHVQDYNRKQRVNPESDAAVTRIMAGTPPRQAILRETRPDSRRGDGNDFTCVECGKTAHFSPQGAYVSREVAGIHGWRLNESGWRCPECRRKQKEPYKNVKNTHETIIWHSPEKISKHELTKFGRMPAREVVVQRDRPNLGSNRFTWEVMVNDYTIVDQSKGEFIDTGATYEASHKTVKVFHDREDAIEFAEKLLSRGDMNGI